MSRIIKLTESDLNRIVKRVIVENESKRYSNAILLLLETFKEDCVCGFEVDYNDKTDIYLIKMIVGNKDLDNKFMTNVQIRNYLNKLKKMVNDHVYDYLPIRFLVDVRQTPKCKDFLGESNPHEDVISEVKKVEDFDEDYPDYVYSAIGVLPSKTNPNQIGVVFFNGPDFTLSDYREPQDSRPVYFLGPLGEFEFDSRDIHFNGKSPYVFGNKLKNSYYDKLFPLLKSKTTTSSEGDFTSDEIRESTKMAFPEYWEEETDDYTAGLRGIHTIGEKTDTDIDWSIMNFFDTKKEVKALINKKWNDEGSGDKIEWLSSVLRDDEGFLNKLLSIQWNSIKGGFENEIKALKNLTEMLEKSGIEFEYDVYPPGHKRDRYDSIDLTLKLQGEQPMALQIKPVTKTERMPNGDIKVYTYGMTNNYKRKDDLGYILYNKGNSFIIFKNKNYYVTPASNGTQVIHKDKPFKVYKG